MDIADDGFDPVGEAIAEALRMQQEGRGLSLEDLVERHPDLPAGELTRRYLSVGVTADLLREAFALPPVGPPGSMPIGRRLGDYEVLDLIGEGAMASVYRARRLSMDREVALKILPPGMTAHFRHAQRFDREIHVATSLRHAGIVQVLDHGEHEGCLYYAMELIQGADLGRILAAQDAPVAQQLLAAGAAAFAAEAPSEHWLTHPEGLDRDRTVLVWWLAMVARALQHAHEEGVVHRDVKPSNILVGQEGRARIGDFGLARALGAETLLTFGTAGTPVYMSPEQAAGGSRWTTPATDIYSLGATLYHAATDTLPFGNNDTASARERRLRLPVPPRRIAAGVPRTLQTIILRAMDPNPALRHPSMEVLANDLEGFLRGEPVWARPLPLPLRSWRVVRRRPMLVALSASLAVAAIATPMALRSDAQLRGRLQQDLDRGLSALTASETALRDGRQREAEEFAGGARQALLEVEKRAGGRAMGEAARQALVDHFLARLQVPHAEAMLAARRSGPPADPERSVRRLHVREDGRAGPLPEEAAMPTRAFIRGYLERRALVELPAGGVGGLGELCVADILDSGGRPGADGREEILAPGADGRLWAISTGTPHALTDGRWSPDCRGLTYCSMSAEIVPAAEGRPRRLAVLADLRLSLLGPTANGYGEVLAEWDLGAEGAFGRPLTPDGRPDPHGRVGPLVFVRGPHGAEWLATGTEAWKESGDKPCQDGVVDLATGKFMPLTDSDLPGGARGSMTHGLAAVDLDHDEVDEILMARAEWEAYGLTLLRWNGGRWEVMRHIRMGAVHGLVPCGGSWFLVSKQDHENPDLFDRAMPSGLPRGIYPLAVEMDAEGPALRIHGEWADLAIPEVWGEPLGLVVADLDGGRRLVLALLELEEQQPGGNKTAVSVLAAYLLGTEGPVNLQEGRQLFRWEGQGRPTLLVDAGNFDGDAGEEVLVQAESGELLILGWDGD